MDALRGAGAVPGNRETIDRAKRTEAVRGFEEMFLTEMMKAMRRTVPGGEEESQGRAIWREQFDAAIARKMAESGGIGLAELLSRSIPGGGKDARK